MSKAHHLTGRHLRAARAILNWTVRDLAERSGISVSSIRRIETGSGVPENVTLDLLASLRSFLESRGFQFFDGDSGEIGIHYSERATKGGTSGRDSGGSTIASSRRRNRMWTLFLH